MKTDKAQQVNRQDILQLYKILLGGLLGLILVGCETAPPTAMPPTPTVVTVPTNTSIPPPAPTARPILLSPTAAPSPTAPVRVYDAPAQGVALHSAALGIDKAF